MFIVMYLYVFSISSSPFCQSDESDESSEEESATDKGGKCLSDGKKKKVHFCVANKCKK